MTVGQTMSRKGSPRTERAILAWQAAETAWMQAQDDLGRAREDLGQARRWMEQATTRFRAVQKETLRTTRTATECGIRLRAAAANAGRPGVWATKSRYEARWGRR